MNKPRIVLFSIVLSAGLGYSSFSQAQTIPPGRINPVPPASIVPLTIQERIAKLEEDLARLQGELRFIHAIEDRGGLTSAIVAQFKQRTPNPRTIEVGIGRNALLRPKRGRIFTAEERKRLLPSVVMTVDGLPIREHRVEEMMDYLKSYLPDESEEELMGKTILALAAGEWPKTLFQRFRVQNATKIRDIHNAAVRGVEMANLAENRSDDRDSAERGGDLGFISRDCEYGLNFAMTAFSLDDGEISGIFSTYAGLHILQRTGYEKGETPDKDRVRISHVLVLHAPDLDEVNQARDAVVDGRAKISVRDQEFLRFMPRPYR